MAAAAIVLAACQPASDAASSPSATLAVVGAPPTGDPAGDETSVFDLETGDCFNVMLTDAVESVFVVPCDQRHVYEAFAVLEHPAAREEPFPGQDQIVEYADSACQGPFPEYVGAEYLESDFYITSIHPSEATWAAGDREIICALNLDDDSEVTGSARNSGR